jgi:hypothetical protein
MGRKNIVDLGSSTLADVAAALRYGQTSRVVGASGRWIILDGEYQKAIETFRQGLEIDP